MQDLKISKQVGVRGAEDVNPGDVWSMKEIVVVHIKDKKQGYCPRHMREYIQKKIITENFAYPITKALNTYYTLVIKGYFGF